MSWEAAVWPEAAGDAEPRFQKIFGFVYALARALRRWAAVATKKNKATSQLFRKAAVATTRKQPLGLKHACTVQKQQALIILGLALKIRRSFVGPEKKGCRSNKQKEGNISINCS